MKTGLRTGSCLATGLALASAAFIAGVRADEPGWPQYGGDQGGSRYSAARQITPANVGKLTQAWSYSTGA